MRLAGVPEEYRDASIEEIRPPVREMVRSYGVHVADRVDRGQGALIFGPVGTGKSSTAACVVGEAVKHGVKCRWSYVPDLCDAMIQTFRRQEVRSSQVAPGLLIWDDFGVRPFSEFELGVLDQIVEARYRQRKATLVTTNLTSKALADDPRFARMVDRWRQRNEGWSLSGASRRRFEG